MDTKFPLPTTKNMTHERIRLLNEAVPKIEEVMATLHEVGKLEAMSVLVEDPYNIEVPVEDPSGNFFFLAKEALNLLDKVDGAHKQSLQEWERYFKVEWQEEPTPEEP